MVEVKAEKKQVIPLCIVADTQQQSAEIFEKLNLGDDFRLVANNHGEKNRTFQFFEAIILAGNVTVPYEQKAPVQIKYRKDGKKDKDQLMSKILKSQIFSQIASQKELIRTAI